MTPPQHPDHGPRGYLPPRAAKRARKIMLREPMGLQWAIAALLVGALVLVAGGVAVVLRSGPPGPPFVASGQISRIDPRGAGDVTLHSGRQVVVLRGAGGVSVFAAPQIDVAWCAATSRLVAQDGSAAWEPTGRLVGGDGRSLTRLPAQVHDGVLYVDAAAPGERLAADPRGEPTTCGA